MKKLFNIELTDEEFDRLMCEQAKGKELKVINNQVVAVEHELTEREIKINRITELKSLLNKYKYDIEQVDLFGMKRSDYEEKKELCSQIVMELRELEKSLNNEEV